MKYLVAYWRVCLTRSLYVKSPFTKPGLDLLCVLEQIFTSLVYIFIFYLAVEPGLYGKMCFHSVMYA